MVSTLKARKVRRRTGRAVQVRHGNERYPAFVPFPLPPDPPLALGVKDRALLEAANRALGRLDAMTALLPEPALFVYSWVRKEALVSAQIEGTQSSYEDLLLYESDQAPGVPVDDVREVSDYVAAIETGLARLRKGTPLSTRLLREIHAVLLRGGRGRQKNPGTLRRGAVWIGGRDPARALFVPPPAARVRACLDDLAAFAREPMPVLVKAALAHVQLLTIHPFRDGNGRLGRLLVTLLLCADGALHEPTLFLSLHFKENRAEYYARLQAVRTRGDWEGWLRFFLQGVIATADEGVASTRRVLALFEKDRRRLERLGRRASTAFRVHEHLQKHPIAGAREIEAALKVSYPTVAAALTRMERLGIVREITGFKRNRVYAYAPFISLLSEGADPIP